DAGTLLTITGVISGPGDLNKVGVGTVVLGTGANTYTGQTNVNAGVLNVQAAASLGLAGANVTVTNGTTLQVQGAITIPGKALTLNGAGFGNTNNSALPQGALVVNATATVWTGSITLTGTVGPTGLTAGNVPLLTGSSTSSVIGA